MLTVQTTSGRWQRFCEQISRFLENDVITLNIDGKAVRGYRSPDSPSLWIRDHSDMLRAGIYFEQDVCSAVEAFAGHQAANGRIFDFVMVQPLRHSPEKENWERWVRVPVEADVEYRFIKAAHLAWRATGEDAWLVELLPAMENALRYATSHPLRWDERHGLVKRPYTIDTWDFDYTAGRHDWLNFQITENTFWGISHGDNSGVFEAANLLARGWELGGDDERASHWRRFARELRSRANALLFNGRFYRHFHKITPVTIPGVDEEEQLSLSTPMAINRGLATHEIAVSILQEYRRRRKQNRAFAEWFGIDPPFPDGIFGDEKLVGGAYINGGIFPLCGGELARAAFEHGFEPYGLQTLEQYRAMIAEKDATYLWYFPDGTPASVETSTSPEAQPTDGWGSSAMLYAFVEGLCGIVDLGHSFQQVRLTPRWAATDEDEAEIAIGYAASGASFAYRYHHDRDKQHIFLNIRAENTKLDLRLLMPESALPISMTWGQTPAPLLTERVRDSLYVLGSGTIRGSMEISISYELPTPPRK